jgi:hypothetical protein
MRFTVSSWIYLKARKNGATPTMPYPLLMLTDDNNKPVIELYAAASSTTLTPTLKFYTDATGSNFKTTSYSSALLFEKW